MSIHVNDLVPERVRERAIRRLEGMRLWEDVVTMPIRCCRIDITQVSKCTLLIDRMLREIYLGFQGVTEELSLSVLATDRQPENFCINRILREFTN